MGETICRRIEDPIPWPKDEKEMLKLQMEDIYWGPIARNLAQQLVDGVEDPTHIINENKKAYIKIIDNTELGALMITDGRSVNKKPRTILPSKLIKQLTRMYHDQMGHPSAVRTLASMRIHYYWYGMDDNVTTYVQTCEYCRKYKANNRVAKIPIQAYGAPASPFDVIHIDITGLNLPKTTDGNNYILVVKDALSRYVEVFAIPNKSELTVDTY